MKQLLKDNIYSIEATTEKEAYNNAIIKKINYKPNFNLYIIDFGGYFGLSMLIYSNGRMIKFANDYQLHHRTINSKFQLAKDFLNHAKNILFTFDEIVDAPLKNYDDYSARKYFICNHLPCAFDHKSIFCLSDEKKDFEIYKAQNNNYCECAFAYFKNKNEAEMIRYLYDTNEEKYKEMMEDDNQFKQAVIYEMFNHESAIDWDGAGPALNSLGFCYKKLSYHKKMIVQEAYKYVCENTKC